MKKLLLFVTLSMAVFVAPARSQAGQPSDGNDYAGPYVSIDVGGALTEADVNFTGLTANAGGTPDGDLEEAFVVGGAIGWDFGNSFRIETEFRRRSPNTKNETLFGLNEANSVNDMGMPLADISGNTFNYDGSLRSSSLMANVYYDFDRTGLPITPYIKGGAGIAFNKVETQLDATLAVADQFGATFNNVVFNENSSTDFAWNIGAGLSIPISQGAMIELEYLHADLGNATTQFDALGDAIRFSDIESDDFTIGLRIKF